MDFTGCGLEEKKKIGPAHKHLVAGRRQLERLAAKPQRGGVTQFAIAVSLWRKLNRGKLLAGAGVGVRRRQITQAELPL